MNCQRSGVSPRGVWDVKCRGTHEEAALPDASKDAGPGDRTVVDGSRTIPLGVPAAARAWRRANGEGRLES